MRGLAGPEGFLSGTAASPGGETSEFREVIRTSKANFLRDESPDILLWDK